MVIEVTGGSCTTVATCPTTPVCGDGTIPAPASIVNDFCQVGLAELTPAERATTGWCARYNVSGAVAPQNPACLIPLGDSPDVSSEAARPTVLPTPAPEPARPGDTFRCRFLCAGDTHSREGNACTAATDQNSCIRQCNTVCGPYVADRSNGCLGLGGGGTPDGRNPDQEPQCLPVNVTSSVGGISDSQHFESINESFAGLSIPVFIGNVVRVLLGVAGALFFAMLIWGGIQWMTASGDPAQVKAAQTTTRNAIIGVIIIVLSYTLVSALMQVILTFAGIGS